MATAPCTARTPIDRYGIRPVDGLPDMDRIMDVQLDALDNRKHTPKPAVFVEPLVRVAEQQAAFVGAHVMDDVVYAVAETLEIGDLVSVVPADGEEVTQDCVTLHAARIILQYRR